MSPNDLFPGDYVKIIGGRHRHSVGEIISYEKGRYNRVKVEVRIPLNRDGGYDEKYIPSFTDKKHKSKEVGSAPRSLVTWVSPDNIELLKPPKVKEVSSSKRLLLITEKRQ